MDWIAFLAYFAGALSVAGLFYGVGTRRNRPIYEGDSRIQSKSLFRVAGIASVAVGFLLSVLQSFSSTGLDLLGLSTVVLTSMVSFLLVVSAYTDHRYRMADRVLLRWGFWIAVGFGVLRLLELQSEPKTVLYAVAILLAYAVMFVPSIGASDSRAFMILFAVGIPILDIMNTYYVFLAGIILWLGYGIVAAVRQRSFKVSIPLVPYILLPLTVAPILLSLIYGVPAIIAALS